MKLTKYRYFASNLEAQSRWLNKMADEGWRLIQTGMLGYTFESCAPGTYRYAVEFIGHKSYSSGRDYKSFFEELGYGVFYKNINLNYSIGKLRWRPYGEGAGQFATNPGGFNRELLILEKKNDGKPFELHTTQEDLLTYYKPLLRMHITVWLLCAALFVLAAAKVWLGVEIIPLQANSFGAAAAGILTIVLGEPVWYYGRAVRRIKNNQITHE